MRYRSIPIYVEADSWRPGCDIPGVQPAVRRWPPGSPDFREDFHHFGVVDTPTGPKIVRCGDYVVTYEDGTRDVVAWDRFSSLFGAVPPKVERTGLRFSQDDD